MNIVLNSRSRATLPESVSIPKPRPALYRYQVVPAFANSVHCNDGMHLTAVIPELTAPCSCSGTAV